MNEKQYGKRVDKSKAKYSYWMVESAFPKSSRMYAPTDKYASDTIIDLETGEPVKEGLAKKLKEKLFGKKN